MAKFLLMYRVPREYKPTPETNSTWQSWFEAIDDHKVDTGHGVVECRELGNLGPSTRPGGYTVVEADDLDAAVALASGAPSIGFGGGVEVGAIPDVAHRPVAARP